MSVDVKALIAATDTVSVQFIRDFPDATFQLIAEMRDALEAKERENPSNCNCGYGGFHETENKNCEANQ